MHVHFPLSSYKLCVNSNHMAAYFFSEYFPMPKTRIANIHTSDWQCPRNHHVRAERVSVVRQPCLMQECCGLLEVPASVSHGRWLTLSLSSLSLSALASFSFFSISTRSSRHGLWEEELHALVMGSESPRWAKSKGNTTKYKHYQIYQLKNKHWIALIHFVKSRAATNDYFHHWLICRLFSRLID